jgi:hypothetical protein
MQALQAHNLFFSQGVLLILSAFLGSILPNNDASTHAQPCQYRYVGFASSIERCKCIGRPNFHLSPISAYHASIADASRELIRLRDAWLNPPNASEAILKQRTLTNLYNQRPEWLANAHRTLDEAVLAAYGWPADLPKEEILARLLALNQERAATQTKPSPQKVSS